MGLDDIPHCIDPGRDFILFYSVTGKPLKVTEFCLDFLFFIFKGTLAVGWKVDQER